MRLLNLAQVTAQRQRNMKIQRDIVSNVEREILEKQPEHK
jgi:hypothetical protein